MAHGSGMIHSDPREHPPAVSEPPSTAETPGSGFARAAAYAVPLVAIVVLVVIYAVAPEFYLEHVLATRTTDRGLCIVVSPGPSDTGGVPAFAERVRQTLARSRP